MNRCLKTGRFLGKQHKTRTSGHKNLSKKNAKAHTSGGDVYKPKKSDFTGMAKNKL